MSQKEEQLLLKDLCARLPYGVKCFVPIEDSIMELTGKRLNYLCFHKKEWGLDYSHELEVVIDPLNDAHNEYIVKPCLRSMSSMTWDERKEYLAECDKDNEATLSAPHHHGIDWLDRNMFDYRGLIPHGLAIEITKDKAFES